MCGVLPTESRHAPSVSAAAEPRSICTLSKLPNQYDLGANAYLFRSDSIYSSTVCILAHGARPEGAQFTVPENCTIHYHTNPGASYKMTQGPFADYTSFTHSTQESSVFRRGAGEMALDVILGKILGSHWQHWGENDRERGYRGLAGKMLETQHDPAAKLHPHVVVVRGRNKLLPFTTPYLWLSEIVRRVMQSGLVEKPVNIHLRACLGVEDELRDWRAGKQQYQVRA
jgi:hypothetical protein